MTSVTHQHWNFSGKHHCGLVLYYCTKAMGTRGKPSRSAQLRCPRYPDITVTTSPVPCLDYRPVGGHKILNSKAYSKDIFDFRCKLHTLLDSQDAVLHTGTKPCAGAKTQQPAHNTPAKEDFMPLYVADYSNCLYKRSISGFFSTLRINFISQIRGHSIARFLLLHASQ